MCKFRSYKHSCGHTTHRPHSTCRFTYCTPGPTGDKALCRAAPELVVGLPDTCRSCEYQNFCSTWESRIADARAKQSAARSMIQEIQQDPTNDSPLSWGGTSGLGYNDGTDINEYSLKSKTPSAKQKTDSDLDNLWKQYQREQMQQWRIFVSGPNNNTESAERKSWRRRRPSAKCSGDSPLKQVISIDEVDLKLDIPERRPTLNNGDGYEADVENAEDWGGESPFSDGDGDISPMNGGDISSMTTREMRFFELEHTDSNNSDEESAIEDDDELDMAEFLEHEGDVHDNNDSDSDNDTEDPASPKTPPRSAELPGPDWRTWDWPSHHPGDERKVDEAESGSDDTLQVGSDGSLGLGNAFNQRRALRKSWGSIAHDEAAPDLALPDWGMA